tara:strand:- start:11748 stop:12035 length:288 start_codon:yes stop_codon:yes gene_type:complete
MNDQDEFLYLIANPMKKKKTYVYENINEDIQLLLQKKYKKYNIDEDMLSIIFKLIEGKLFEIKEKKDKIIEEKEILKLSERIVSEIFYNVLSKHS